MSPPAYTEERPESRAARERVAEQLKLGAAGWVPEEKGRPTKRDRRALDRLRGRAEGYYPMFSTIARANPLVETSVAPCIRRSKS